MKQCLPTRKRWWSKARLCRQLATWPATMIVTIVLAVASLWPVIRQPASTLVTGSTACGTVPLFNLWTTWWNSNRVLNGGQNYWNAPIFHPQTGTFGFSEPQPATLIVAPILWLSGSRVLASNSFLLISLVFNSVFTRVLLRNLGFGKITSLAGAVAVLLLPVVHEQAEAVQLVPLWGILWTWDALIRASRRPSVFKGLEAGAAIGVVWWHCAHHGLFLTTLLIMTVPFLVSIRSLGRVIPFAAAALVCSAMTVLPIALPLKQIADDNQFQRRRETVLSLSARYSDYCSAYGMTLIQPGHPKVRDGLQFGIGWGRTLLALFGVLFGLARRRFRRVTVFFILTGTLAFLLSLGPDLRLLQWSLWDTVSGIVPGFGQVRSAYRFAFFVQLSLVLLGAIGLHGAVTLWRRFALASSHPAFWRRSRSWAALGLSLLLALEVIPKQPIVIGTPDENRNREWIEFVRNHTSPHKAIACLPFASGNQVADFEITTRWMYYGTFHGVPLVNGYSGFFPESYFQLRQKVGSAFPDAEGLRTLSKSGVEFLVVIPDLVPGTPDARRIEIENVVLERRVQCHNGVVVFELLTESG